MKTPRRYQPPRPLPTAGDLQKLIKETEAFSLKKALAVRLMAQAGFRSGELSLLKLSDFDLIEGRVFVSTGDRGKGRAVYLRPETISLINDLVLSMPIDEYGEHFLTAFDQGGCVGKLGSKVEIAIRATDLRLSALPFFRIKPQQKNTNEN